MKFEQASTPFPEERAHIEKGRTLLEVSDFILMKRYFVKFLNLLNFYYCRVKVAPSSRIKFTAGQEI